MHSTRAIDINVGSWLALSVEANMLCQTSLSCCFCDFLCDSLGSSAWIRSVNDTVAMVAAGRPSSFSLSL